jgi:predicted TIM-barrel fold metal-dependent hydrolase
MIIDTHFHAFPDKFLDSLPDAQNDVRGVGFRAFDQREYLDVMDKYGIDIGVLSNTGGRIEKTGRARAVELCKILNDAFAEAHAKFPQRFMAFARLPMVDMDDCVRELERCYKELKMHGVMMPTNVAGKYIDEAEFAPFWDASSRPAANRCSSILPTHLASPIGTSIRCTRKFFGRRTARWRFRASSTPAFSIAIQNSN